MSKNNLPSSELTSATHLLKRFNEDMRAVHNQMEMLKIVFENLKHSWYAISLVHKIVKSEVEDKP
ncbi:MAG: hypothetical protein K2W92_02070 [Alphaproteobacteria bacterium]|nr:hypothetical protein [Alphaproteobacteria bacterium]